MRVVRVTTLVLAVWFMQGCSSSSDNNPAKRPAPADSPPQKTVFDPLKSTLDRARSVQGTVDQSAERTREAVDKEERGDSAP